MTVLFSPGSGPTRPHTVNSLFFAPFATLRDKVFLMSRPSTQTPSEYPHLRKLLNRTRELMSSQRSLVTKIQNPTSNIRLLLYSMRMLYQGWILTTMGFAWCLPCPALAQPAPSAQQALQILKQNCATCHGASQQMSGYDLRTREA